MSLKNDFSFSKKVNPLSNIIDKVKNPTITSSQRALFFAYCFQQNFSLSDSVIYYITKNPLSPKIYQKLIQSCKYFFIKNTILIFHNFSYTNDGWIASNAKGQKNINLKDIFSKFWIIENFNVQSENINDKNVVSLVFPYIYQCNIKKLDVDNQIISYDKLKILSSNAEEITLWDTVVMHNGTAATLEKVFECFSRVKSFICTSPNITSKTFESLLKIPQFLTILSFWLYSVSEDFDIDSFNIYMKKNKHSKIRLDFCGTVSEAYKNRLNLFVDEIIATENQGYKPPLISCDGLDGEKYGKLYNLYIKNL